MTWRRRVELRVEVGLRGVAAGNMVWDVSQWDVGTWSGLDPEFVPLSGSEVESLSIDRGRDRAYSRMKAGTAEVVLVWRDVEDRWSMRASSPIQLGQELRMLARVLGYSSGSSPGPPESDWFPLYRGAVRSIRDTWDAQTREFRLTARMVDRFADLGAVDLPEQPVSGLGDTTAARVGRILELAGISTAYFDDDSTSTVQHGSSNFARNLLDEAQVAAESDYGTTFYVGRDGLITLRRPSAWLSGSGDARATVTHVIWSNAPAAGVIGPTAFGTGQDLDDLRSQVSAARAGGTALVAADAAAQVRFGLRTLQRFDLTCRFDADVQTWADGWLAELKDRTERIDAVSAQIDPSAASERIADLLDIELLDRHVIEWQDGAGQLSGWFWVQGVRHRVTPRSWRVTVTLWTYAGFGFASALWGSATWGQSEWSS